MGIIWLRCSAELRARWRAVLMMALIVGIGGGVALSAFGGALRTDTAMASFVSYSLPDDGGFIYGSPSRPTVPVGPAAYSLAPSGAVRRNPVAPSGEGLVRSAVPVHGHQSLGFGRGDPQSVRV